MHNAKTRFTIGDRIYYTGDMANLPSTGTVIAIRPPNRFCAESYDIELDQSRFPDDDRMCRGITSAHFQHSPGRRFWALEEWEEDQAWRLNTSRDQMLAVLNH